MWSFKSNICVRIASVLWNRTKIKLKLYAMLSKVTPEFHWLLNEILQITVKLSVNDGSEKLYKHDVVLSAIPVACHSCIFGIQCTSVHFTLMQFFSKHRYWINKKDSWLLNQLPIALTSQSSISNHEPSWLNTHWEMYFRILEIFNLVSRFSSLLAILCVPCWMRLV